MHREKMSPIEQQARDSLAKYNDRRYTAGTEGIAAKEGRALQQFFDQIVGSEEDDEEDEGS